MIDIAIIGAGPAGMTAGIYAARAGLRAVIFERMTVGGQIVSTHLMENYPGFPEGVSGADFAECLKKQAERFNVEFRKTAVTAIHQETGCRVLETDDGEVRCRALIIATGAQPRKLGVPNEDKFTGEGISYCATCDGAFFRERTVCVVGGGDTALEDALYLSNVAEKVYLIHRRSEFRAQSVLVQRAEKAPNIEFLLNKVPTGFYGSAFGMDGIELKDTLTGEVTRMDVDGCFLAVGYVPDTEFLRGIVSLDQNGYIIAGEDAKTGAKGIFVAGDVRTKRIRQVVTAVSDGAAAALAAREYIEEQGYANL